MVSFFFLSVVFESAVVSRTALKAVTVMLFSAKPTTTTKTVAFLAQPA